MWVDLQDGFTQALEVPGVGVMVRYGQCAAFVPGARVLDKQVVRDDRQAPPLRAPTTMAYKVFDEHPVAGAEYE